MEAMKRYAHHFLESAILSILVISIFVYVFITFIKLTFYFMNNEWYAEKARING
jgi:hypothetical protein